MVFAYDAGTPLCTFFVFLTVRDESGAVTETALIVQCEQLNVVPHAVHAVTNTPLRLAQPAHLTLAGTQSPHAHMCTGPHG